MAKVTGVFVDPDNFVKEHTIENDIHEYHRLLDCELFDITSVRVNGVCYDVFCDDEGLFKSNPKPSIVDIKGKVRVVGKCFFAGHDEEGNTISLEGKDIRNIMNRIRMVMNSSTGKYYEVILCDNLGEE